MKIDVHQHLWTEPLVQALATRSELPFVRRESGLTVLYLAGERPYVIDLDGEAHAQRAALVELDGLDRALVCLSSPLDIEWLPRAQALPLIDAYLEGALSLREPFGVWGAIALDRADPADVDRALARGCVGLSLPAGALAGVDAIASLHPVLARLEAYGAPLLVHPGAPPRLTAHEGAAEPSLCEPLWWPALTGYLASMQAAWLAFLVAGRPRHPRLRVVFCMLAGLAPLHAERLFSRGGPSPALPDPLVFYETSSYGPQAVRALARVVGPEQLLYGSDRPVVEPGELGMPDALSWEPVVESTRRAFAASAHTAVAV
ncbi:MAG TPA: amidohydrolase family protein [Solirubrobacteraceae bacterium]|nr:amidohydrolase family protein [Solirubrobacteraceae bacterium]